ncbi:unnamed protein product [Effrenium voratum]|uniref:Uncharacterized protein n=1 Tax=Effrenium voratum TaxID=2562239 RepID=A0AA36J7Q0_9DINO|nr:unnamed protein product [Effrenium voratum]CAJ1395605.1 unnamed protein product [Effrenium voratum]CAJ1400155.1 unnamed protein product [Effrenium voratum]CAJ1438364.1 unnamed protein product [Effrenium voratum]
MGAKLRRLCTRKSASRKLEVPDDIHRRWQSRGQERQELLDIYINCGGDKSKFIKTVTHKFKKSRKGTIKVNSGFYSEEQMKQKLSYGPLAS